MGDKVLMRNVRDRGGTGKMKSYWEESIFEVTGKKENLPVFTIRNLKKCKDIRVVHRNMLMKCEELSLDIFEGSETDCKPGKKAPKVIKSIKSGVKLEDVVKSEDEDPDINVIVYHHEDLVSSEGSSVGHDEVQFDVSEVGIN